MILIIIHDRYSAPFLPIFADMCGCPRKGGEGTTRHR